MNVDAQIPLRDPVLNSVVYVPGSRIAGRVAWEFHFYCFEEFGHGVFYLLFNAVLPWAQGHFLEGCRPSPLDGIRLRGVCASNPDLPGTQAPE